MWYKIVFLILFCKLVTVPKRPGNVQSISLKRVKNILELHFTLRSSSGKPYIFTVLNYI